MTRLARLPVQDSAQLTQQQQDEIGLPMHAGLAEHSAQVRACGFHADAQLGRDLRHTRSPQEQLRDAGLGRGEAVGIAQALLRRNGMAIGIVNQDQGGL
jgi:hypothetical protein